MVTLCLIIKEMPDSSKVAASFYLSTSSIYGFPFPRILVNTCYCLFIIAISRVWSSIHMHFLDVKTWKYIRQGNKICYDKRKHEENGKRILWSGWKRQQEMFLNVTQLHVLMQLTALSKVSGLGRQPSISHLELIIIIATTLGLRIYFIKSLPMLYPIRSNILNLIWESIFPTLQVSLQRPRVANDLPQKMIVKNTFIHTYIHIK